MTARFALLPRLRSLRPHEVARVVMAFDGKRCGAKRLANGATPS
ncbi:hypothetical protein NB311A_16002 [Nitrobacter sp. Nb-311A]|nr:hypothetical protein NB311A_16002 [Nitrobacter sp. Nb-311A]